MRFAFTLPNFGPYADVRTLCALAREAEERGWDGFFLWDHINWSPEPTIDPWVALAAVACATSRIRIGTMVTPLPRRRPWIVARQAATLDHLSGGRVILGVGLGYPPDREYAAFGDEPDDRVRGEMLDEALAIVTGLWSGEEFSFEGAHYRVAPTRFLPKPLQEPRIAVWTAGTWPLRAPFRRAGRFEGVVPMRAQAGGDFQFMTPADVRAVRDHVASLRADGSPFEVAAGLPPPGGTFPLDEYAAAGLTWWLETEFTIADLRQRLKTPLPR